MEKNRFENITRIFAWTAKLCPSSHRCTLVALSCCTKANVARWEGRYPHPCSSRQTCPKRPAPWKSPKTRRTILDPPRRRSACANGSWRRILGAGIRDRKSAAPNSFCKPLSTNDRSVKESFDFFVEKGRKKKKKNPKLNTEFDGFRVPKRSCTPSDNLLPQNSE